MIGWISLSSIRHLNDRMDIRTTVKVMIQPMVDMTIPGLTAATQTTHFL